MIPSDSPKLGVQKRKERGDRRGKPGIEEGYMAAHGSILMGICDIRSLTIDHSTSSMLPPLSHPRRQCGEARGGCHFEAGGPAGKGTVS